MALAESGALTQSGQAMVTRRVLGDVVEQGADGRAHLRLRAEPDAELIVAARPLHEHDEELRDLARERRPVVGLDQRQREVDARGPARRREHHVKPPGTSSVSIGPATSPIDVSTPIRTPELETTASPSSDAMRTR